MFVGLVSKMEDKKWPTAGLKSNNEVDVLKACPMKSITTVLSKKSRLESYCY
jgi:hypothetical protein